jgi:hypothetical protein
MTDLKDDNRCTKGETIPVVQLNQLNTADEQGDIRNTVE